MSIDGEAFVSQEFKTPLAFLSVLFFVISTTIICFCCYCTENVVNCIKDLMGKRRNHQYPPKSPVYTHLKPSLMTDRPDFDTDSMKSSESSFKSNMHSKIFRYGSCPNGYQKFSAVSRYKDEADEAPGCYISAV